MSHIFNPCYLKDDGSILSIDGERPWGETAVRWTYCGQEQFLRFATSISRVVIDPSSDLLIVALHLSDPIFRAPNNAAVFNPAGSLNHQIRTPKLVRKGQYVAGKGWIEPQPRVDEDVEFPPGAEIWTGVNTSVAGLVYRVEGVSGTHLENDRVVIGLRFAYEWCEERYYDPGNQVWQERRSVYRF